MRTHFPRLVWTLKSVGNDYIDDRNNDGLTRWVVIWEPFRSTQARPTTQLIRTGRSYYWTEEKLKKKNRNERTAQQEWLFRTTPILVAKSKGKPFQKVKHSNIFLKTLFNDFLDYNYYLHHLYLSYYLSVEALYIPTPPTINIICIFSFLSLHLYKYNHFSTSLQLGLKHTRAIHRFILINVWCLNSMLSFDPP